MKKFTFLLTALLCATMSFAATKTVVLDGSATGVSGTATSEESTISQNGFSYTMSKGGKNQSASGGNKFDSTTYCILIGKSDAYIYNNTPFNEKITKFELYSNKGASKNVSVSVSFSAIPISAATTESDSLWTATLSTADNIYDVTVPEGAKYFYYKVTNSNNSQVAFRITYEVPEIPATGIALDKTTLTLDKGATEQLTATLTPADATTAVVWATDNAAVATVANGLVTAVGVGTANITATVTPAEGTSYTATCVVTVVTAPDAPTFTVTDELFEGSMNVAISAADGMKIYYTTNGDEPTTASTEYTAPFEITATTTVKAIAYDEANTKASVVATNTYTKALTCAEANAAADKAVINLNTVTVVYVNGSNIYVADATGGALIYKYEYGLEAGQVVKGLKGSMSIYKNLPEIVPSVTLSDLTITEGAVPEPTTITAVPTTASISQYVRIEGVKTTAATWKSSDYQTDARTLVAKLGADDLTLYNTFKIDQTFAAGNYNIVGFVTCYNTTVQIAVVSAKAIYNVETDVNEDKMGSVTGDGDYEEGSVVTLTAKPNTGYEFVNWTDLYDKVVSTDAAYTFTVTEEVALIANFKENAFSVEAIVNDDAMGTIEGIPTEKVAYGTEITLTAKPATGYQFVNWTDIEDKEVSTDAAYTFTVTEEVMLQANFKEIKPATWYGQEPLTGTLSGVNYSIVYEITRNIEKTLTFKLALNDEAAAVAGLKITIVINNNQVGYITENFTSGVFTTSGYYTDGDELKIQFYLGSNNGGDYASAFNYIVGSSNDKPTAIDAVSTGTKATKRIENGVLIIEKNGIRYNAQGVVVE